jgi:golgi-specific brefeldin A-resistance guanine nucleotide exchange factor 1
MALQYEAVPESLKNIILVMHAADILVPPAAAKERSNQQQALWDATHERIERFLPGFLTAVVPTSPPSLEEKASTSASQPT